MSDHIFEIAVGLLLAGKWAWDRWMHKRKNDPANLAITNDFNEKIYPELWKPLWTYRAVRICIIQFHNGEHYYSGAHIQKVSCSHEVSPEMEQIKLQVQNLIMPTWVDAVVTILRKEGQYYIEDVTAEHENIPVCDQMKSWGVKAVLFLPIRDKRGNIIAVKMIQFNYGRPLNKGLITAIKNHTNKIQHLFQTIKGKEKE